MITAAPITSRSATGNQRPPVPVHQAISHRLAELTGHAPVTVKGAGSHEVYLERPEVLADFLQSTQGYGAGPHRAVPAR
jgi:hypothetical protein